MTLNQYKYQKLRHNRWFLRMFKVSKGAKIRNRYNQVPHLINRIPGSRLLISSLPGSAFRTHVESLGQPRDVNMRSQSLAW